MPANVRKVRDRIKRKISQIKLEAGHGNPEPKVIIGEAAVQLLNEQHKLNMANRLVHKRTKMKRRNTKSGARPLP